MYSRSETVVMGDGGTRTGIFINMSPESLS